MFDNTVVSLAGFSLILILFWLIFFLMTVSLINKIYKTLKLVENKNIEYFSILKKHRVGIFVWLVLLIFILFYTSYESAYRPKTIINNPAEYQISTEMSAIDEGGSVSTIEPSQPFTPIGESNKAFKDNAASNAAARKAFEKLKWFI